MNLSDVGAALAVACLAPHHGVLGDVVQQPALRRRARVDVTHRVEPKRDGVARLGTSEERRHLAQRQLEHVTHRRRQRPPLETKRFEGGAAAVAPVGARRRAHRNMEVRGYALVFRWKPRSSNNAFSNFVLRGRLVGGPMCRTKRAQLRGAPPAAHRRSCFL